MSYYDPEVWHSKYYPKQKAKLADPEARARKNRINRKHMRTRADLKKQRYIDNKFMFLRQLGGKCELCGFQDWRALQFDHTDPKKKTRNLPSFFRYKDLAKAFNELHNCRLLCANCHAVETHNSGRLRLGKTYIQEVI
jgi:hypothetical protein